MIRQQIKVLVVDDSAFMRRMITTMLETDPALKVIDFARDGNDALVKIKRHKPDVVTMDVEMPGLDGLSALKKIMCEHPIPVIMLSSLTTAGASQTMEALSLGAVDFVPKPANRTELPLLAADLIQKIKTASEVSVSKICRPTKPIMEPAKTLLKPSQPAKKAPIRPLTSSIELIAVGTSTGGPTALQTLLTNIPKDIPCGIVIVQHMPKGFTGPMAKRLNDLSAIEVKEAEHGDLVTPGRALVAPAGQQLIFAKTASGLQVKLTTDSPIKTLFKPSVDVMLLSAVEHLGPKVLGIIMTGMGNDGLQGLTSLKKQQGTILAQNEASSIVYGMPKAAVEAGIVDKVLHLNDIAGEIISIVGR